jgi:Mrp family chromosome partitioning ATPase
MSLSSSVSVNVPTPTIAAPLLAPFEPDPAVLESNHIVAFNARDLKSRPFSLLRTQVLKRMEQNGWKIIGITSPTPGAGKSFLTANLGASLSRLPNRSTYLFDLDLRRSSLGRSFGMAGELGMTEYLSGECDDLSKIGQQVNGGQLSVYPSYGQHFDSFELLAGERFDALVGAMRALPDDSIVLCDMPPAFAHDDAMVVGQKLDAYIMVIEQGVSSRTQVRDCKRLMEPTPCLGTVLNRYEGGLLDPYGYGYGSYGKKYDAYYGQ